jgi:hypothetical protein
VSLDLYVCALDLGKLGTLQGCGDRKLLRRIVTQMRTEIQSYDKYFLDSEPRVQPLARVISQIIQGELDPNTPRFQFEGATAIIADAIGKPLATEIFCEAKGAFYDEIDCLIGSLRKTNRIGARTLPSIGEILQRGPFIKIPLDSKMRLGSGYLTVPEVTRACAALTRRDLKWPLAEPQLKWPALAREAVMDYRSWLTRAAGQKLALFMHR